MYLCNTQICARQRQKVLTSGKYFDMIPMLGGLWAARFFAEKQEAECR